MIVLEYIQENWQIITFFVAELFALFCVVAFIAETLKCMLRKDILDIYDKCKETKQITEFQLQSVTYSYDVYKKLGGNSFIDTIVLKKIPEFEVVEKENHDEN